MLLSLPLELFPRLVVLLDIPDLVHLSHTCKAFHDILTSPRYRRFLFRLAQSSVQHAVRLFPSVSLLLCCC